MFASTTLTAVFIVVFAMTGVYALARLSQLLAGTDATGDRLVELFHLAMSLAMIGMAVAWTGGPETASGRLQIVVFGVFTLWFAYRAPAHGLAAATHLVTMAAAMTWMVATMSVLMGPAGPDGSGHSHHGAPADTTAAPGSEVPVPPAPGWVVAVTIAFAVLFVATGCWQAIRAVRAGSPPNTHDGAVATRTTIATSARVDGLCHALMSLGMAGMLVAML